MGQLECPLADGLDGWLDDMMEAGWLAPVEEMTRGLACCLGLVRHTSRGLGQAMCGPSGERCHGGNERSQDLFTFRRGHN